MAGAHPRGDLDLHARGQLDGEVAEAHRSVALQGLAPVDADLREVERALADAQLVAVLDLLARARRPRAIAARAPQRDVDPGAHEQRPPDRHTPQRRPVRTA